MVNGHVYPEAERLPGNQYRQPRQLYWNVGGRFKEISVRRVLAFARRGRRGSAAGDLDNDGSLEIVVSNIGNRPSLLKNLGSRKNWLLLRCVGVRANRDAIGALVSVEVNGRRMAAEIQGDRASSPRTIRGCTSGWAIGPDMTPSKCAGPAAGGNDSAAGRQTRSEC